MDTFLVRIATNVPAARLRQRLAGEVRARILLSLNGGSLLVAQFDRALRETVSRWPEVALVGGVNFAGRQIRRIRVDKDGQPLPPAIAQPAAPAP